MTIILIVKTKGNIKLILYLILLWTFKKANLTVQQKMMPKKWMSSNNQKAKISFTGPL
jgi:hypothetical protein